jgi:hypothetical protein
VSGFEAIDGEGAYRTSLGVIGEQRCSHSHLDIEGTVNLSGPLPRLL